MGRWRSWTRPSHPVDLSRSRWQRVVVSPLTQAVQAAHARASGAPQRVGRLSTTRARRRCSSTRGPALDGGCGGWD